MKLTEAQRRNLAILTKEWQSVYDIAIKHPSGVAGVSGIAKACSGLAKAGYAEWTEDGPLSAYRITEAGRAALKQKDGGNG